MKFSNHVVAATGTGIALLVLICIGVLSYRSAIRDETNRAWVSHTTKVLEMIDASTGNMIDAETGERGYLLTGDDSYLKPYEKGASTFRWHLRQLRLLTVDNPVQQHSLDLLEPAIKARLAVLEERIAIRRSRGLPAAAESVKQDVGQPLMTQIRDLLEDIRREEQGLLQQRLKIAVEGSRDTKLATVLGNALALIFLVGSGLAIHGELRESQRGRDEIERLNQSLEFRVAELTAANRELDAFTYSLAHDLRAPLRHIQGFGELLRRSWYDRLDDDGRHLLGKILVASKAMGDLVDELLDFARLGQVAVTKEEVDLGGMVERVRQELEPDTNGRGLTWTIGPLPSISGDPALLHQVLVNLLSNAVKYTRKSAHAYIEIGSQNGGGEDTIFVRDNGAGFDMQYVDKLFRVFQRLHRADEFDGNGVGLANVRRIIERHGGRVWAEGALGSGATFYFSLPRRQISEQTRVHSAGG